MQNKFFLVPGLFTLLFSVSCFAQIGHLTVFSEEGDKFFLILNGERQNDLAQTNIRVEDLRQPQYSTRIIFEDRSLGEITKTLYLYDQSGTMMDVTYKVRRDKSGNPKLSSVPFSYTPVRQGFVAPEGVYVVHTGTPRTITTTSTSTPATTVTQTTTTHTEGNTTGANVNVGGINMNVTISDPVLGRTIQTTTTQTTTTSNYQQREIHGRPVSASCASAYPMSAGNFSSALSTVADQGFDETRLKTAKQIASGNCLNTDQIVQVCQIFGFEETKLDFAKFAYDHCTERKNYFKVNNVFSFSSSSDQLNEYILGKK